MDFSFLKPSYLYLLFLIPILLLLYMLRLKRKTQIVSSSMLWEQAIEDIKANTPFQRLRKNILLPLQILFLMLIIFALARPFWRTEAQVFGNTILIIDESASMKANDAEGTRFDAAKSSAMKMIKELGNNRKMMIIEARIFPRIAIDFTSDKFQLQNVIEKTTATDATTDLENAIQLALSIADDTKGGRVVLLSDGAVEISPEFKQSVTGVQFIKFGQKDSDNVGITAFEVGSSPSEPSKIQVFVAIQNFSSKSKDISIELYRDKNLIDVRELNITTKERRSIVFDGIDYVEGTLKATINVNDHLSIDNSAYYVLRTEKPSRVLIISDGNLFINEAIRTSSAKLEVISAKPEDYPADNDADLLIFDSFVPKGLPEKNITLVNPGTDLPFAKMLSKMDNPRIINWDGDSPAMRFVDLSNLRIDKAFNYQMPAWMKPLVESDMGTLIWIGENEGRRLIVLPFEIKPGVSNNFPMLPAFPIFMDNAVNWLLGLEKGYSSKQVKPGEPLKINIPEALLGQNITVKKPDGQERKFQAIDRDLVFEDTDEVGIYSITGNRFSENFAANLLDESESNIEPKDKLLLGNKEITSSPISATNTQEIWNILVLVAFMLLAIEWWAYHRRVMV